ncbi:Scr1 family TA system antitoxin-like transcriptional regulator [Streptomyces albidoflavus]|uniref:helix-turn-helix domain-containing protein n=1 Tax=Streptomyces TaxID=1883 RepID=UPI00189DC4CC|nr:MULTISPECIES: helix-turn-helix transcriptional regulator [Streptomyces]UYX95644.1 helix-turn-helix transcriptional regulator [Streptomyces sp. BI87]
MPGGQTPKELTPDSGRMLFGLQLRKARQQRGLSMDAFIEEFVGRTRTPISKASLGRIERGEYLAQPVLPALLDRFFETKNDMFADMYDLACLESVPHQYKLRSNLERDAVAIKAYGGTVIPGLLQTEEYARELFRAWRPGDEGWSETQGILRRKRQARLSSDDPPLLSVLVDETVLTRQIGTPDVMRTQWEFVLSMVDTPTCEIHMVPAGLGAHGLLGGTLILMTTPKGQTYAYEEAISTGTLVEAPERVQHLERHWDRLWGRSLSPMETARFLKKALEAFP